MILKMLIFAFSILIYTVSVKGEDSYCDNPIVESDSIVDLKFIHENYKTGWNTQFGNSVFMKWSVKMLQRIDEFNITDSSSMCLRSSFDLYDGKHMFGYHSGMGLTSEYNCTDLNHIYECHFFSPDNGYRSSAKLYLVYFDQNESHNSFGLALCFPDGTVGWQVGSITKKMSDEETTTILNRFKTVGFDTSSRMSFQSETCP